jgi:hypothetical protein
MADVPLRSDHSSRNLTFYNQHGDWFGWDYLGTVIVAGMAVAFQRRNKS